MGHDFIEDFRGPIWDRANDAEEDTAGDATPRAVLHPRLPFAAFFLFDLARAQRAGRDASALGGAPPARAKQGKAPQDRFVCIKHNDLALARLVLEGGKFERAVCESSWGGI